jgi:hypothetical protein
MKDLVPSAGEPWLIAGDFNLIYEARDKNNDNLCRRLMRQFRAALNQAELFELRCSNRKFSWSNERELPRRRRTRGWKKTPRGRGGTLF